MFASVTDSSILISHCCRLLLPSVPIISPSLFRRATVLPPMEKTDKDSSIKTSSFSPYAQPSRMLFYFLSSQSSRNGGSGRGSQMRNDRGRTRGGGGGREGGASGSGKDKIDALGRLLTRILHHMASELNLNMWGDGYVKVNDLLKLNMKTFANIQLRSHTIDEVREAVRKDNNQRFSLTEEDGELLICANQGHTIVFVCMECTKKTWNQFYNLV